MGFCAGRIRRREASGEPPSPLVIEAGTSHASGVDGFPRFDREMTLSRRRRLCILSALLFCFMKSVLFGSRKRHCGARDARHRCGRDKTQPDSLSFHNAIFLPWRWCREHYCIRFGVGISFGFRRPPNMAIWSTKLPKKGMRPSLFGLARSSRSLGSSRSEPVASGLGS